MSTKTPLDDLTEKQAAFVREYTELGQARGTRQEACRRAGYEGDNLDVVAWDLLRKPKILAACRYMLEVRMMERAPEMVDAIYGLAINTDTDFKGQPVVAPGVRLQAANSLLDRAGMAVVTKSEQKIAVEDNRTPSMIEYQERVKAVLTAVSLDPELKKLAEQKLLPVVEAEFMEVIDLDQPL